MVLAELMWIIWQERNTRIFEDSERPLDLLKPLLFGSLFLWTLIWGCTSCISISDYLLSLSFSS